MPTPQPSRHLFAQDVRQHLEAGLDPRDIQFLSVNRPRKQPERVRFEDKLISIE